VDEFAKRKDEINQELQLAKLRLHDSRQRNYNLAERLDFAESALSDATGFWQKCDSDQKQGFQKILFPEGLMYANGAYRTTPTSLLFTILQANVSEKQNLVALTGIEPVFRP
jgi:hypothetical protein